MKTAVVCIAKNEDRYIQEWVEYHLKLGFDDIFLYENNWRCGLVGDNLTKIPFDGEIRQLPAYNHFLETHASDYDWAAFIDVDEFIILKQHDNIKAMLLNYENVNALTLNWVMVSSVIKDEDNIDVNANGVIKRFLYIENRVVAGIKFIANLKKNNAFIVDCPHYPRNVLMSDTHFNTLMNTPDNINFPTDIAYLNHYYYKTHEEFLQKCANGRADWVGDRPVTLWYKQFPDTIKSLDAYNFMYGNNDKVVK